MVEGISDRYRKIGQPQGDTLGGSVGEPGLMVILGARKEAGFLEAVMLCRLSVRLFASTRPFWLSWSAAPPTDVFLSLMG